MSSELIGELGQVGLRIGECGRDEEEVERKRARLGSGKQKRFRHAWMLSDIFKDWLRPHPNPELAMCIACDRVVKAGKSELEKHAVGKKHLRMLKGAPSHDGFPDDNFDVDESGSSGGTELNLGSQKEDLQFMESSLNSGSETQFSHSPNHQMTRHYLNENMDMVQYYPKAVVGKPAPSWKATAIVNGHITRLDLSDYKGRYLILFFYPQDFNKLCAAEMNRLSDRIAEFRAIQTEIVACSVDSHLSHLAWSKTSRAEGGIGNPKIPILTDPTRTITRDYGVLLPEKGHALRAHFIIDRQGTLRHMSVNDTTVGRGTDELLRLVKAIQHSDNTEESCPPDWRPMNE